MNVQAEVSSFLFSALFLCCLPKSSISFSCAIYRDNIISNIPLFHTQELPSSFCCSYTLRCLLGFDTHTLYVAQELSLLHPLQYSYFPGDSLSCSWQPDSYHTDSTTSRLICSNFIFASQKIYEPQRTPKETSAFEDTCPSDSYFEVPNQLLMHWICALLLYEVIFFLIINTWYQVKQF